MKNGKSDGDLDRHIRYSPEDKDKTVKWKSGISAKSFLLYICWICAMLDVTHLEYII